MPKRPAFEDEVEFEGELKSSTLFSQEIPASVEDDEFDVKFLDIPDRLIENSLSRIQIDPQLEHIEFASEKSVNVGEIQKFDLKEAAKSSFNEIASIYSSGLGDVESRTLGNSEAFSSVGKIPSALLDLKTFDVIEECDEEAEEREERQEEVIAATLHNIHADLESEWAAIEIQRFSSESNVDHRIESVTTYESTMKYFE